MDKRIAQFFEENREEILKDISRLVAVDSVRGESAPGAPFGAGPRRALDVGLEIARARGLEGRILGDRMLVIEAGEGEAELAILAHLDVVPPAGEWRVTAPYEMRELNGRIYGRGVIDDKGPAVVSLWAILCAQRLGLLKRKVQLLLGSDEECGSGDLAWYLEHYPVPGKVFTPDGSFPVANTEKGRMHFVLTAPAYRGEEPHVTELAGGSVPNAVPARCEAVLSDGTRLETEGRAAHGSLPREGDNAVTRMIERLAAMEGPGFRIFRTLRRAFPHGNVDGSAVGADCRDELSGELTVNLGVMKADAEGIRIDVDCRIPVCGDGHEIAARFEQAMGPEVKLEILSLSRPHHTPADSNFVRGLLRIYGEYTGTPGRAFSMGGGTYVHEIEGGVAFGAEFPGADVRMHEPDERVEIGQLLLAGEMYAEAVCRFCG